MSVYHDMTVNDKDKDIIILIQTKMAKLSNCDMKNRYLIHYVRDLVEGNLAELDETTQK